MLQHSQALLAGSRDRLASPQALGSPSEPFSFSVHLTADARYYAGSLEDVCGSLAVRKIFPWRLKEDLRKRESPAAHEGAACATQQRPKGLPKRTQCCEAGGVPSAHGWMGDAGAKAYITKGTEDA